MSEVKKLEAVKRSLAIANRVTSSALVEAKKHQKPSLEGGKKRRRSGSVKKSGKKVGKKSGKKRSGSPKRH